MASTAFMLEESDLKLNAARLFQRPTFYNPDKLERVGRGDGLRVNFENKSGHSYPPPSKRIRFARSTGKEIGAG